MVRWVMVVAAVCALALSGTQNAGSQSGRKLKDQPKADPQKGSWEQVDRINREADGTRSRYDQSRTSAGLNKKGHTGGMITKRHVLPPARKKKIPRR